MITGLTNATPKKLLLDAGAFYKNYDLTKTVKANAANLLGATQGGGSFSAVPTVRKIEVDGAKGNVKGLEHIDEWVVTMVANCKETTVESLKTALGAAKTETVTAPSGYTKITGKNDIEDADYLSSIAWVGKLSGADESKPVIIVLKNALCLNGLSLTFADKSESLVPATLTGHYAYEDLDTPPFEIYYPTVS